MDSEEREELPYRKKKRIPCNQRKFGIQYFWVGDKCWHNFNWYETEKQRDQAFSRLSRTYWTEVRKIDRE